MPVSVELDEPISRNKIIDLAVKISVPIIIASLIAVASILWNLNSRLTAVEHSRYTNADAKLDRQWYAQQMQLIRQESIDELRELHREIQALRQELSGQPGRISDRQIYDVAHRMPSVDGVIEDYVDVLELNHFYDDQGKLVFDQIIGWDWTDRDPSQLVAVFWILKKEQHHITVNRSGGKRLDTFDHDGALRRVYGRTYRETWTQYDPELRNREILPKEQRRGLTPATKPTTPTT